MKDYGEHLISGWIQTGDIHGNMFGVWVTVSNGHRVNVMWGEVSGKFWVQVANIMCGTRKTPEQAARKAIKVAAALPKGLHNQ